MNAICMNADQNAPFWCWNNSLVICSRNCIEFMKHWTAWHACTLTWHARTLTQETHSNTKSMHLQRLDEDYKWNWLLIWLKKSTFLQVHTFCKYRYLHQTWVCFNVCGVVILGCPLNVVSPLDACAELNGARRGAVAIALRSVALLSSHAPFDSMFVSQWACCWRCSGLPPPPPSPAPSPPPPFSLPGFPAAMRLTADKAKTVKRA